jgi:hypothetical protein
MIDRLIFLWEKNIFHDPEEHSNDLIQCRRQPSLTVV